MDSGDVASIELEFRFADKTTIGQEWKEVVWFGVGVGAQFVAVVQIGQGLKHSHQGLGRREASDIEVENVASLHGSISNGRGGLSIDTNQQSAGEAGIRAGDRYLHLKICRGQKKLSDRQSATSESEIDRAYLARDTDGVIRAQRSCYCEPASQFAVVFGTADDGSARDCRDCGVKGCG